MGRPVQRSAGAFGRRSGTGGQRVINRNDRKDKAVLPCRDVHYRLCAQQVPLREIPALRPADAEPSDFSARDCLRKLAEEAPPLLLACQLDLRRRAAIQPGFAQHVTGIA
jgi:hypothetical protein